MDESNIKEQRSDNECIVSGTHSHREVIYSDKNKQLSSNNWMEMTSCVKEEKSLKISSALDSYCKTNILDESADFVDCEIKNKFISGAKKSEILCEICKENITHLDAYNRGVHVNNCIDKQISPSFEVRTQTSSTENVFILECPLCFKHFSSPELRSSHIKKCGKSKGLSTQSIIKALELQERHALERISLGLPAKPLKPVKSHKNPVTKKVVTEPKNKAESDIQLAKALSLSLRNSTEKDDVEISENIATLMLKPPDPYQRPGKKTKRVITNTPLLVLRTEEDRKKLLLDKVAAIVTPMNNSDDSPSPIEADISADKKNDNHEVPILWQLSSKTSEKYDYYVEPLLDWIKPSNVEMGAKLCHLSQIPGHKIVTQLPCEYTFNSPEENDKSYVESTETSSASNSNQSSLTECLRSLVASSWMSDVDIHTSCGTVIPAHRLLLAVRCPPLKQDPDFCSDRGRVVVKWETVSFDAALQFLNFIYTGNIEIKEVIASDLFYLAKKYEVFDLQTVLHAKDKTYTESEVELYKKSSPDIVEHTHSLHSSPQTQAVEGEAEITMCESQEDINMDLEIVYNCINSNLQPSQPPSHVSTNLDDTIPFKCSQTSEVKEDGHASFRMDYDEHKSVSDCTEKATAASNCLSPKDNHPTSPVIFDVNDSESDASNISDNEDIELPMNCSQKSVSRPSNLDVVELDLFSAESNNSDDSVKFLQSSYTSFNNLCKTPKKEGNLVISSSPKLSKVTGSGEKSLPTSSHLSQNSPKLDCKKYEAHSRESDEFVVGVCDKFESTASSYSRMSHLSHLEYENKTRTLCNLDLNTPDKDFSGDKNMLDETIKFLSPVKNGNNSDISSLSSEKPDRNSRYGFSIKSSPDRSDIFPETKPYECEEHNSPDRNTASPIILLSDSDSNSQSRGSILRETSPVENYAEDSSHNGIESNIPVADSPVASSPDPHKTASAREPEDDHHMSFDPNDPIYEPFDYYDHEISFPYESEAAQVESPRSTDFTEEKQTAETGNFVDRPPVKCLESHSSPLKNPDLFDSHSTGDIEKKEDYSVDVEQSADDSVFEPKMVFSKQTASSQQPSQENLKNDSEFEPRIVPPKPTASSQQPCCENLKNAATPTSSVDLLRPKFRISDSPITPLPDYKNMKTPDIKEALKKIGVKALPRKKAVAMLSHIYDETHPFIGGETNAVSCSQESALKMSKVARVSKPKKRKQLLENLEKPAKKKQKENQPKGSCLDSPESDNSDSENPEWLGCVPEMTFSQGNQDSPTKPNKDDIESIKQYIQSNENLYNNILTYTPLNMVEFHQELKNNDIKISIQKLMDFLDEQCITFTCPRKEEYRKKQTARTQRFRKNMIAKLSQQAS